MLLGINLKRSELNFFKNILENKKVQILKNILGAQNELAQLNGCELNDEMDHVSINNNQLTENAIAKQQQQELSEINTALHKIASNEYGICDMCGDDIGFQRLKVKPHAVYCIYCREIIEKSQR